MTFEILSDPDYEKHSKVELGATKGCQLRVITQPMLSTAGWVGGSRMGWGWVGQPASARTPKKLYVFFTLKFGFFLNF